MHDGRGVLIAAAAAAAAAAATVLQHCKWRIVYAQQAVINATSTLCS